VGVGLTLAKALIEAHDGSVVVESGGLGHGTTVKIALPRLAEPAAVVSLPVETPGASMVSTTERARAMDQSPPSNPQVLVIEDNLDAARTLGTVLTLWGYRVQLAHTGPDGVKAAQASRPQIVLCDIGLPGMDGYEVARTLRATPDTRNARLIAITGYGREEDSRRAREAGFDVHLVKPVEPTTLRRRLAS
jgi:CheY-like chemotaxis protein